MRRIHLALFTALIISMFALAACGSSSSGSSNDSATGSGPQLITFADMPDGIGRGYPTAIVEQGVQNGAFRVGDTAPNFWLQLEDGRYVRLSDLKGKPVVINFWATWCPPCRAEMPEFVKTAADEDLVVLAVNDGEDRKAVEEFAAAFGMTMPVVLDRDGMLNERYLVQGLPTTYFIDSQGKLSSMVVGQITPEALEAKLAAIRTDG
ncbi:MAG: redoxin domain-containing protein [Caldilineaceae bacterium]